MTLPPQGGCDTYAARPNTVMKAMAKSGWLRRGSLLTIDIL